MTIFQPQTLPDGLLETGFSWEVRVDSWLGGDWLGRVPVAGGSVAWSRGQQVQGSLSLTVPRVGAASADEDARDWTPVSEESPLSCLGQILHITAEVGSLVSEERWTFPLGRFLITQWEIVSTSIRITGKSLLHHLEEDRLTRPTAPLDGGRLSTELRRLVGGYLGVSIDRGLVDRACPSMSWGESRIDAVYEIADAWPARIREGPDGVLHVLPPVQELSARPARTLTDGAAGTVIGVSRQASRGGVHNRVVVRGQDQDGPGNPRFQAVADQSTGPMRVGGPYGTVTKFFSSPLITSPVIALETATTMLTDSVRRQTTVPVTHVPDPTLGLDDPVELITHPAEGAAPITSWGVVSAMEIPLVPGSDARTDIEVIAP